ncbi:MAG: sodium:solute symporter [Calditrichaceae bacterium]
MSLIDWIVMGSFLIFIVAYGTWKSRGSKDVKNYLLANNSSAWYTMTLSIMATQASAITFLSTPGQAFVDGMRFVQFYLGLPIAMIILSITAVPIFHRLKVYTAYEYLEQRFDLKNRILGSALFLTQRGLAAGFTIFAPALIISVLLGWDISITIFVIGILVIIYTAAGGTVAVNKTHMLQMIVITFGMFMAFVMILRLLPADISILDAMHVAGKMGRLNVIDFKFDLSTRYNIWSGLIGGTFLMLSYFGTDQSQVQRYLSGKSITHSRMALLTNGLVKIPMQFIILFIGAMVFVFYQFQTPPIFFNPVQEENVKNSHFGKHYSDLENQYNMINQQKRDHINKLLHSIHEGNDVQTADQQQALKQINGHAEEIRREGIALIQQANPDADTNDTNYIFLNFVISFLPVGLIGLVFAAILSASMSSTSAELNALASTTVIDFYKRLVKNEASERHYLIASKLATIFWGFYAIGFALFANRLGSLIEAVNILGSLFYGTILGIFLVAFFIKHVKGTPTFIAAVFAEVIVLLCFFLTDMPFLWFNFIGCITVIFSAVLLNPFYKRGKPVTVSH